MYVTQIDDIIDRLWDTFYAQFLSKNPTYLKIVAEKKANFVEYRKEINSTIQNFMDSIDKSEILGLISNQQNLARILDIIKRYITYYYFLSLAYNYPDTINTFRNNLIKYSKLQENSEFYVKNFFDTENNLQLITLFKVIKDISRILLMSDLQRKGLDLSVVKGAVDFLNTLSNEYIDQFLLQQLSDGTIVINEHNLVKTIIFQEIYRKQEQKTIFGILNEVEEAEGEFTYIEIVVSNDDAFDLESFRQMFLGEENGDSLALDLYRLVEETMRIGNVDSIDNKNSLLVELPMVIPVVDDFLRYHRDNERLNTENKAIKMPFIGPGSNIKNIQFNLQQKRKNKETTKAQLIVNKIDVITDYYSVNVRANPKTEKEIASFFQNSGSESVRKTVLHNYYDELRVLNKIVTQKAIEANEYFLELKHSTTHAYYNFKDFQKYGASINLENELVIQLIRYSNFEHLKQATRLPIDAHSGSADNVANVVGFCLPPLSREAVICIRKENLLDIREVKVNYMKYDENKPKKFVIKSTNGYEAFIEIVIQLYIETIRWMRVGTNSYIYNDYHDVIQLNPNLDTQVVYWLYDLDQDEYETTKYENLKSYNNNEIVKFMNSIIYDRIYDALLARLRNMIRELRGAPLLDVQTMVELFSRAYHLNLSHNEKADLISQNYLRWLTITPGTDIGVKAEITSQIMPQFTPITDTAVFRIEIDTINPLNPQRYRHLEAHGRYAEDDTSVFKVGRCRHENDWNRVVDMKRTNVNRYNAELTQFIEQYAIETLELDFVCKICGQMLPLKQYVQDGTFDNVTQKFVTSYVPLDVPLEQLREYQKYALAIKYLDGLTRRMSLIIGTNVFVGSSKAATQRRKSLIKQVIDIIVKHNSVNLARAANRDADQLAEERSNYYAKNFRISKDLDIVFFYEFDDANFNFSEGAANVNLNRLKFNIVILYFLIMFFTELNGAQIGMMFTDKIANIYTYLDSKTGARFFGNLAIRKNTTDNETVRITEYPVLGYLLFVSAYFLIKYQLWYFPQKQNTSSLNPVLIQIIINSFVDLINSIIIEAGRNPNDYVYLLTVSKLYYQLNNTFKNDDIINLLKRNHKRYRKEPQKEGFTVEPKPVATIPVAEPMKIPIELREIPVTQMTSGLLAAPLDNLVYPEIGFESAITNCNIGSFHRWFGGSDREMICTVCKLNSRDADLTDRTMICYYFNLNKIANRRCIAGTLHDFVAGTTDKFTCSICGRKPHTDYTQDELDELQRNLNKLNDESIQDSFRIFAALQNSDIQEEENIQRIIRELSAKFTNKGADKLLGYLSTLITNFTDKLQGILESDSNLSIDKYPVFLRDDVYIIDHNYRGVKLPEPYIISERENKIFFKANDTFFKTDVYFYTDNKTQTDVFYHAVTLRFLGYKERHKSYVSIEDSLNYLKISYSIKNRLAAIGYENRYINIGNLKGNTIQNFYILLDNLIRDHIHKIKSVIDKFAMILYKVKNNHIQQANVDIIPTQNGDLIAGIVNKFSHQVQHLKIGPKDAAFDNWNDFRTALTYDQIDWKSTNVKMPDDLYVNINDLNHYDTTSTLMMHYLFMQCSDILDANDGVAKITLAQLFIEIINYIYNSNNIDRYRNSLELKRFEYILMASNVAIDILRKGQPVVTVDTADVENVSETGEEITELTEEEKEYIDELKEETEALDIDNDYRLDEDEDNNVVYENEDIP